MNEHESEPVRRDAPADQRDTRRRPPWLWVAAAVTVVGLLAAVLVVAAASDDRDDLAATTTEQVTTTPRSPGLGEPISEFRGSGDGRTDPFEVGSNWEVRWELTSGGLLQLELFSEEGSSVGVIAKNDGEMSGLATVVSGGKYYLQVASDGEWSVGIFEPE